MANMTAHEVYLLQMINRARLDPLGEAARYGIDLNAGLSAGTITSTPKQPLAPNQFITTAAQNHTQWMLDTDTYTHSGAGGSSPGSRMSAAGYSFTGNWTWSENIAIRWRSYGTPFDMKTAVDELHASLFQSAAHRRGMLKDVLQEAGIGVRMGDFQGHNSAMVTEDFGKSGTGQFLTGVTYLDANGDKFYTPGEGKSGISIVAQLVGAATGSTVSSNPAGDYTMKLASGEYMVTFSGAGLVGPLSAFITVAAINIELDVFKSDALASSATARLGANVRELDLLGTANLDGTGNALANLIVGNKGANVIDGGAGADSLVGGAGFDTFKFKAGEANGDVVVDFAGNGSAAGDSLLFEGYGAAAQLVALGNNQYRITGNGFNDVITVNGAVTASDYSFAVGVSVPPTPPPPSPPPPSPPPPSPPPAGDGSITGTTSADTLTGSTGDDVIKGLAGRDRLTGGDGDDVIYGGADGDSLIGGIGDDILIGEGGTDYLTGGAGRDIFVRLTTSDGTDQIMDFTPGVGGDVLDISDVLVGFDAGDNPADFVRLTNYGSLTGVGIDADGAVGGASFSTAVYLMGVGTSDLNKLIADGNLVMS